MFEHFLVGFLLATLATFFAIRFFPQLDLLDFPERYNLKRAKLPYPGGLTFVLLSLGLICIDLRFWPVLPAIVVLGLVGFYDDRYRLSALLRLVLFALIGTWLVGFGIQIDVVGHPFKDTNIDLTTISVLIPFVLTVLWLLVLQNALNWFDGMPGLSVGITGIGFLTLGVLSFMRPELWFDPMHQGFAQAHFYLAGLCLGAFYFYWQEKIILGDTGSQVLGLLLGVMAIISGAKIATTLLVLALPILDFFWVIFRRLFLEKKNPMKGDLGHLHHRLQYFFSPQKTTLVLLIVSMVFGTIAVFLTNQSKLTALVLAGILVLIVEVWLWRDRS